MANSNGDAFRVSRATLLIILAIGSPVAGLSVGGYMLREQVKKNEQQETQLRQLERNEWNLERDVKELREDVDRLMAAQREQERGRR